MFPTEDYLRNLGTITDIPQYNVGAKSRSFNLVVLSYNLRCKTDGTVTGFCFFFRGGRKGNGDEGSELSRGVRSATFPIYVENIEVVSPAI